MAKKITKKKKDNSINKLIELFKKDRSHFLAGVSLAFLGAYTLLGQISFFFTGGSDQSKIVNRSFFELVSTKQDISNWTGVTGAFLAENLINGWLGIFSLALPVFMIFVGLRLMKEIGRAHV